MTISPSLEMYCRRTDPYWTEFKLSTSTNLHSLSWMRLSKKVYRHGLMSLSTGEMRGRRTTRSASLRVRRANLAKGSSDLPRSMPAWPFWRIGTATARCKVLRKCLSPESTTDPPSHKNHKARSLSSISRANSTVNPSTTSSCKTLWLRGSQMI